MADTPFYSFSAYILLLLTVRTCLSDWNNIVPDKGIPTDSVQQFADKLYSFIAVSALTLERCFVRVSVVLTLEMRLPPGAGGTGNGFG